MTASTTFYTTRTSPFNGSYGGKAVCGMPRASKVCCKFVAATCLTRPISQSVPPTFMRREQD
eukprot:6953323-Prorocentrum_lima.AAC.1